MEESAKKCLPGRLWSCPGCPKKQGHAVCPGLGRQHMGCETHPDLNTQGLRVSWENFLAHRAPPGSPTGGRDPHRNPLGPLEGSPTRRVRPKQQDQPCIRLRSCTKRSGGSTAAAVSKTEQREPLHTQRGGDAPSLQTPQVRLVRALSEQLVELWCPCSFQGSWSKWLLGSHPAQATL